MRYAAVIAAAGISSRMHEFKPMLWLGEETMIQRIIHTLRDCGVEEIMVVTGYRSEALCSHLEGYSVSFCENTRYATSKMFDSICMGISALHQPYDRLFITPGDVPLVQVETIRAMQQQTTPIVRPHCGGTPGHPLLLDAALVRSVLDYHGKNGLRGALESLEAEVCNLETDDIGILLDADTPEDFKTIRKQELALRGGGKLHPDIQVQFTRSGETLTPESVQLLEMIDHIGSMQSACACMHMSYSKGLQILKKTEQMLGYALIDRFSGGGSGGGSR